MNAIRMYKNYEKNAVRRRAATKEAFNGGLDELKRGDLTDEQREVMTNSLKNLYATEADIGAKERKLEHSIGSLYGFIDCTLAVALGLVVGKGIEYVIQKKLK